MSNSTNDLSREHDDDAEMIRIIENFLNCDVDITARAVAREHTRIKHASTITRNSKRNEILLAYKDKQSKIRERVLRLKLSTETDFVRREIESKQRLEELEM